jgi:hypothetical protein
LILSQGRLFVWAIRSYDEVEPIVFSVDEADEISIADVANLVLVRNFFVALSNP